MVRDGIVHWACPSKCSTEVAHVTVNEGCHKWDNALNKSVFRIPTIGLELFYERSATDSENICVAIVWLIVAALKTSFGEDVETASIELSTMPRLDSDWHALCYSLALASPGEVNFLIPCSGPCRFTAPWEADTSVWRNRGKAADLLPMSQESHALVLATLSEHGGVRIPVVGLGLTNAARGWTVGYNEFMSAVSTGDELQHGLAVALGAAENNALEHHFRQWNAKGATDVVTRVMRVLASIYRRADEVTSGHEMQCIREGTNHSQHCVVFDSAGHDYVVFQPLLTPVLHANSDAELVAELVLMRLACIPAREDEETMIELGRCTGEICITEINDFDLSRFCCDEDVAALIGECSNPVLIVNALLSFAVKRLGFVSGRVRFDMLGKGGRMPISHTLAEECAEYWAYLMSEIECGREAAVEVIVHIEWDTDARNVTGRWQPQQPIEMNWETLAFLLRLLLIA